MTPDLAEEYTQSLGQIVAGSWRQIAFADKAGIPKALGMTTREWVEQRLGGYLRLSIEERHGAVKELNDDGMSQRQIADVLGIGKSTVGDELSVRKRPPLEEKQPEKAQTEGETVRKRPQKERLAELSEDLSERVRGKSLTLDEAESIADERKERIDSYVCEVRRAIDLFLRMAGHPVPEDLSQALNESERDVLVAVLSVIPKGEEESESVAA